MSCGCGCKGASGGCGSPARSNGKSVMVLSGTRSNDSSGEEMRDPFTTTLYYGALGVLGIALVGTLFIWKPKTTV